MGLVNIKTGIEFWTETHVRSYFGGEGWKTYSTDDLREILIQGELRDALADSMAKYPGTKSESISGPCRTPDGTFTPMALRTVWEEYKV